MKFVIIFEFFTLVFLFCIKRSLCEDKQTTTESRKKTVQNIHMSLNLMQNAITDDIKGIPLKVEITNPIPKSTTFKSTTEKFIEKPPKLVCPGKDAPRAFFAIPCKVTKECTELGNKNMLCCDNRCSKGIPAPVPEPSHSPTLFGLVERVCPVERIPEIWEIKQCTTDADCSPRICCPEKMLNGDFVGFCRTAEPKLDRIPGARQLMEPLRLMMSYMQCTPPPPPLLDVFPKTCRNPLDCFPNLCCQEKGKRFCRPPKRSLLTLLTTVAQRIVPADAAREIITRLAP